MLSSDVRRLVRNDDIGRLLDKLGIVMSPANGQTFAGIPYLYQPWRG